MAPAGNGALLWGMGVAVFGPLSLHLLSGAPPADGPCKSLEVLAYFLRRVNLSFRTGV